MRRGSSTGLDLVRESSLVVDDGGGRRGVDDESDDLRVLLSGDLATGLVRVDGMCTMVKVKKKWIRFVA